jgi:hypothetical protein
MKIYTTKWDHVTLHTKKKPKIVQGQKNHVRFTGAVYVNCNKPVDKQQWENDVMLVWLVFVCGPGGGWIAFEMFM